MSTTEPSWALYEAFVAVMHGGSLSAAARTLQVAQPTVRRQIEALEAALGVVLFTRAPNGLLPTEVAVSTLPYAESIAASARAFVRAVSGARASDRGTVRLTCSEVVGAEVLPPILAALARSHPRIQVELVLSNHNDDLVRREADMAVRMVRPTQAGLVTRRVGEVSIGLYATAGYFEQHPMPATLDDLLEHHALIGSDRERGLRDALAAVGLNARPRDFTLRTDNDLAQLAAVRAGLGIGVCQIPLAAADPRLARALPQFAFPLDVWLVTHEDLRAVGRIRTVMDALAEGLTNYLG